MLIRTQDKTELVNVNNVTRIMLINNTRIVIEPNNDGRWITLGEYSNGEGMGALDKIQEHYNSCKYQQTFSKECGYFVDYVFQMPQEGEVWKQ
jgi:hypothetical protein